MKKKIFVIGLLTMFLLFNNPLIIKSEAVNKTTNALNKNTLRILDDGTNVIITLTSIEMLDFIDFTGIYADTYADFEIKVWVTGGIDDNGDDYWLYRLPDDLQYATLNVGHSWNIGNLDTVNIKIEVWDRDGPLGLTNDLCDINGASYTERSVEFTYNVINNACDLLKSGGYQSVSGEIYFDGTDDGSDGKTHPEDDDDVWLGVIPSDDNYRPPNLVLTELNNNFGEVKVGESKKQVVCWFHNSGDIATTGNVYLKGANADEFTIEANGGPFSLRPHGQNGYGVDIRFTPTSKGTKQATLFINGDDPCNDLEVELIAEGNETKVSRDNIHLMFFEKLISHSPIFEKILYLLQQSH